jgi:hypothetical protein
MDNPEPTELEQEQADMARRQEEEDMRYPQEQEIEEGDRD